MFPLGSKVVVVTSNMTSNTSPRRGSLGYPLNMEGTGVHMPVGGKTLIKHVDVMFTKYGYETGAKNRTEIKRIYVPILLNHKDTTLKDLEDTVNNKELRDSVSNNFGCEPNDTILAFLAPVENFNIKTDFVNWLMVHIFNERNNHMFDGVLSNMDKINPTFVEKIDRGLCDFILDLANHKDNRISRINDFLSDSSGNMSRLITTITMVKTVYYMQLQKEKETHLPDDTKRLLFSVINSLFIPSDIEQTLILSGLDVNRNKIREDMQNIRGCLLSFSRSSVAGS